MEATINITEDNFNFFHKVDLNKINKYIDFDITTFKRDKCISIKLDLTGPNIEIIRIDKNFQSIDDVINFQITKFHIDNVEYIHVFGEIKSPLKSKFEIHKFNVENLVNDLTEIAAVEAAFSSDVIKKNLIKTYKFADDGNMIEVSTFTVKYNQKVTELFNGECYLMPTVINNQELVEFYWKTMNNASEMMKFHFGNSDVIIFNKFSEANKIIKINRLGHTYFLNFDDKTWQRKKFNLSSFLFHGTDKHGTDVSETATNDFNKKFGLISTDDYKKVMESYLINEKIDVNIKTKKSGIKFGYNLIDSSENVNAVILGQNNENVDAELIIGNGKSKKERSNILYIKDGIIHGLKGFQTNITNANQEILLNNGGTLSIEKLKIELEDNEITIIKSVGQQIKINKKHLPIIQFYNQEKSTKKLTPIKVGYEIIIKNDGRYVLITDLPNTDNNDIIMNM